jgi:hypothetical protein
MNASSPFDRIRERELGRLAPAEIEQLERELAADPARRWAEQYRPVHRLTESAVRNPSSRRASRTRAALSAARAGRAQAAAAADCAQRRLGAGWMLRPDPRSASAIGARPAAPR